MQVIDDTLNDSCSYSFLDERLLWARQQAMFYQLVKKYELVNLDPHGMLCWNIPQVKVLLEKCKRLWDTMLHLLFIMLRVSTRVAQFVQLQIRNGDQQRNLQFWNGKMYFMMRDSKTSSTSGKDSCTPAFLSSQVSSILLKLLEGGLQEAEAVLVSVVYGGEVMELHRTWAVLWTALFLFSNKVLFALNRYLCTQDGWQMEAEQFYSKFTAKNSELFNCEWRFQDFHQAAVAMAWHFIFPDAIFDTLNDILAEAADHSTEIDQTYYGRTFRDHPHLIHSDIKKKRWICDKRCSFLSYSLFPIQDPPS